MICAVSFRREEASTRHAPSLLLFVHCRAQIGHGGAIARACDQACWPCYWRIRGLWHGERSGLLWCSQGRCRRSRSRSSMSAGGRWWPHHGGAFMVLCWWRATCGATMLGHRVRWALERRR